MLVQKYKDMLSGKSVIRQLSEFATARGKEIGYENVFDYSLGNPSVPVPQEFTDTMINMLQEESAAVLHGYLVRAGKNCGFSSEAFWDSLSGGAYFYGGGRGGCACPCVQAGDGAGR